MDRKITYRNVEGIRTESLGDAIKRSSESSGSIPRNNKGNVHGLRERGG